MDAKATGGLIARRRKEQNWSQGELAERLHVTDKAISKWETGRGLPSVDLLEPLAEALGLTVSELLSGRELTPEELPKAAEAQVIHSHNYTVRQQFRRNFDLAVSQMSHPEIFEAVSSEAEGMKLVKSTAAYLCRAGKPWLIAELLVQCVGKYAGYRMGKRYQSLSRKRILSCTMSPDYWKRVWKEADR